MSGAQAGLQYAGQSAAADAQSEYQNNQYTSTAKAAMAAYKQNITQAASQVSQESASVSDQVMKIQAAAGQAVGSANVSAAERGVTGGSVDALINDFSRIETTNKFNMETNLGWLKGSIFDSLKGSAAGNQSRISSAAPRPIQGPSPLELGLGLAGAGLGAYDRYDKQTLTGPYKPQ